MLFRTLWYVQHIVSFFFVYIIYMLLRNRLYPEDVEGVRQGYARSIDQVMKAQAWSELVEKHGPKGWIEPLFDELGPVIQLQLSDAADYLEISLNLYKWAFTRQTAATIFFFSVCLLITLVADMVFCVNRLVRRWRIVFLPLSNCDAISTVPPPCISMDMVRVGYSYRRPVEHPKPTGTGATAAMRPFFIA